MDGLSYEDSKDGQCSQTAHLVSCQIKGRSSSPDIIDEDDSLSSEDIGVKLHVVCRVAGLSCHVTRFSVISNVNAVDADVATEIRSQI